MSTSSGDGGTGDGNWGGGQPPGDQPGGDWGQTGGGDQGWAQPPGGGSQGWAPPGQGPGGWGQQQPGQQWQAPPYGQPQIPNYLPWAIVTTVLCCLPFGIVSIVYAAQVSGKQAGGDIAGAMDASKKARTWAIVAGVTGGVIYLGYILFFVAFGLTGAVNGFTSY